MNRKELTQVLLLEQHIPVGQVGIVALCPVCGLPGGGHYPALDAPHEWLLKRNSGLSNSIIFVPINTVLLHARCHRERGQLKQTTVVCYDYKVSLGYDIPKWLLGLGLKLSKSLDLEEI